MPRKQNNTHAMGRGNGKIFRKAIRRQECIERQSERNARTTEQQIQRLDEGGYSAIKERSRLAK